jgi:phage replication O-like protein O
MADVQAENGYTKIANDLVSQFCRLNLSGAEWRVVWAIFRRTYGWNKAADVISVSQIMDDTALPERTIRRVLRNLVQKDILTAEGNHRVGIGTNSPLHALDIVGEMRIKTSGSYGNIKTPNNSRVALQILDSSNAFYGPAIFKNDGGSEKAKITNIGLFGINTTFPTAMLHAVSGATDYPVIIAQAMTGQTANLQEWRDSTGTAKASMSATGYLSINGLGFSDSSVDGAWRITQSGNDLAFQRRESGAWVTKGTITA